jgi:hypothetical protein
MNPSTTWRWLFLAASLIGLAFAQHYFFKKPPPAPHRVLPNFNPAQVSTIELKRGDLELRAERTDSAAWSLTKPLSCSALGTGIESLLNRLQGLTPTTIIQPAELRDRYKADEEFGFANPQCSLRVEQDTQKLHLLIGNTTGPGDQLYLQVVGGETVEPIYVVEAELLKLIPRTVNDWRDTAVVPLKDLARERFAVSNANTTVEFQHDTNGIWRIIQPVSTRAEPSTIQEAIEKLRTNRISQFVSEDPKTELEPLGLQPPQVLLRFGPAGATNTVLQFGKTNRTGEIYARRLGQNTIFTVADAVVAPWRASLNDFRDHHLLSLKQPVDVIDIQAQQKFSLERLPNQTWQVLPDNFAADPAAIEELLASLSQMTITNFVHNMVTKAGLADYGLAAPVRKYILKAKLTDGSAGTNTILAEVSFGSEKNGQIYAHCSDEESTSPVYAVTTNAVARLPVAGWQFRERHLWSLSPDDVAGVTVRKGGKTCQIVRREAYKWSIAAGSQGLIKNELAVEETVRGLEKAKAASWVAQGAQNRAKYGFTDGCLELALDLKTGGKETIQFGGEAPSGYQYAAVNRGSEFCILEFPWPLFRDVVNALPMP